jgi:uncharacterized protein (DUF1330 family)
MKAYMITFVRFTDIEAYNREYIKPAHEILTSHGGIALAVSDEMTVIEGNMPEGRAVIVEFPSMAHAQAFYNDPEYQPLKKIRHKYTQCDSAIIEKGFGPE